MPWVIRFYQEPPESKAYLDEYESRIVDCLNQSQHLSRKGCHKLPTLFMNGEAKRFWVQFFNAVESGLNYQGQWAGLQDFASKAAENAARLAALFHLFEGKMGDIGAESMEQAIAVIHWHLKETRRLFLMQEIKLMSFQMRRNSLNGLKIKGCVKQQPATFCA